MRPHGKRYQQAAAAVERGKTYPLLEALRLAKATSYTSFDAAIELHVRLTGKKPEDRAVGATVSLPYGTGRKAVVAVLSEEMIEEIARSGQAPADIYLATPALMPKVATIAKILGPKGKMPNLKSGTVTDEPEKLLANAQAVLATLPHSRIATVTVSATMGPGIRVSL